MKDIVLICGEIRLNYRTHIGAFSQALGNTEYPILYGIVLCNGGLNDI